MLKASKPKRSTTTAKRFFGNSSDDGSHDYIAYAEDISCKYCGDKPVNSNGYCSGYCAEKDAVWSRM